MKKIKKFLICLYFIPQAACVAQPFQIQVGGAPNNEDGDNARTAYAKVNSNAVFFGSQLLSLSPNVKSNQVQNSAWQITTNTFTSSPSWATAPAGWQTNSEMTQTGSVIAHIGSGFGFVMHTANVPNGANSRFRATWSVDSNGLFQNGSLIAAGFSTNQSGVVPSDNSKFFGLQMSELTQTFSFISASGTIEGSFSNQKWTNNATYNIDVSTDPSNVSFCVVYPGHTNEVRAMVPLSNLALGVGFSNYVAGMWAGTNGTLGPSGARVGSQTISPRTAIEDNSDFLIFTKDDHGDTIRVVIPAQYDSGTNFGNLLVFCHGNTGDYRGTYETIIGDESTTGDSVMGYFAALATNNTIIISFQNDFVNPGKTDSWGTSNSLACVDSCIRWVRQRYAFSNIFLWGESAGGPTALGYAVSGREKIAGVLMNHAVFTISPLYASRKADIDAAYGGSTAAEFAATDPGNFPPSAFAGIPIRVVASTGDTVVTKTNQTDVLVTELGGTVARNAINTYFTLEIDDNAVNGQAGLHGGSCYTPFVTSGDIAFMQRCNGYAAKDVSGIGSDMRISGVATVGAVNSLSFVQSVYTNTAPPAMATNGFYFWNSNGLSSTNAFFLTVNSNGVNKVYHLLFQP